MKFARKTLSMLEKVGMVKREKHMYPPIRAEPAV